MKLNLALWLAPMLTLAAFVSAQQQHDSPYTKWLNEDVVYIISPEERAAYERLRHDEEREMFIEQFWLRRDPDPNTRENPAKEEHYRRIAYANERFGWRSDRGRLYIVSGPPDEIEAHPGRNEIWRYRRGPLAGKEIEFDAEGKRRPERRDTK